MPGRNINMLKYLKQMADDQGISSAGRCGYVTFDEIAIQVRNEIYVLIIYEFSEKYIIIYSFQHDLFLISNYISFVF